MVKRLLNPLKTRSYFLFGPRGSGKSTWIRSYYNTQDTLYFNLLNPETYESFLLSPKKFKEIINSEYNLDKTIIVDEIQKVPALLDIIHDQLSHKKRIFILTGSSARKLKQKGVNLLAGRASVYNMYPFSLFELKNDFILEKALERGLLPESYFASSEDEYKEYLKSYVYTYVEKEIQQEQWVRKIEPFRKFLQVAAQMNSKIIVKSKIARQIGVESSTVESYFEILEDTLLGFRLPGFATSIRKQVKLASKFYFFDTGLVRAIEKTLSIPMISHTSYYGSLFESFVVMEIKKNIEYNRLDWQLSYLCTKEGKEIDLVVQLPNKQLILIEIKSAESVNESHVSSLNQLGLDLDKELKTKSKKYLLSQDTDNREINGVACMHYVQGLRQIFSLAR